MVLNEEVNRHFPEPMDLVIYGRNMTFKGMAGTEAQGTSFIEETRSPM